MSLHLPDLMQLPETLTNPVLAELVESQSQEEITMDTPTVKNVFTPAIPGMGYGGNNDNMNSLWPLLLLAGRGGILGNGGDGAANAVTPAFLASSLASVTNTATLDNVQQSLGDIKASIPFNEAQVQLALAGQTAQIQQQATANATANALANQGIMKGVSDAIATSLASQGAIKESILTTSAANLQATLQNRFDLSQTVRDDGDKTRALLIAQNDAVLNRELTVAQSALLEARSIGRERDNNLTITQTVNQNNQQAQMQTQQQQQFQILANLAAQVGNLANDIQIVRQSQSNINFGTQTGSGQSNQATNARVG